MKMINYPCVRIVDLEALHFKSTAQLDEFCHHLSDILAIAGDGALCVLADGNFPPQYIDVVFHPHGDPNHFQEAWDNAKIMFLEWLEEKDRDIRNN